MDPPTKIDWENATPTQLLLLAAKLGRTDLVMSAINSGADVNAQITEPSDQISTLTALHAAVQNRHIDVTRALLSIPADLHLTDSTGRTALSYLPSKEDAPGLHAVFVSDLCQKSARGDHVALSHAIDAGLDPTEIDSPDIGNTPLHWAASFGASDCVKVLLSASVPLNPVNEAGHTPLIDAAIAGHVAVVRQLVDAGADVTIRDADERPLHEMNLSDDVRQVLGPAKREALSHSYTIESNDYLSTQTLIPPTPTFLPGDSRLTALPPDLPEWASALWPPPRRFCEAGEYFTVPPVLTISAENSCLPVARLFIQWLSECRPLRQVDTTIRLVGGGFGGVGSPIAFSAAIFLRIDDHVLEVPSQAYSICVRDFGIDVVASDPSGLFYACATLVNILDLAMSRIDDPAAPLAVPTLSLSDWPSIQRRGLYLDVSRKRVPTIATLKNLVSFLSRHLKLNQLHLNVTANFDRLKGLSREAMFHHEDILELNQWCKQHFVDFIPVLAQSAFMDAKSEIGDARAAAPNGSAHDMSQLDPFNNSESEMLFDEFLPLFDSEQVNLGNTNDSNASGIPDFARLRALLWSLRSRGKKTLHLFGNQLAKALEDYKLAPSILPELPAHMMTILEANDDRQDALDQACLRMRRHGLPFFTCSSSCLEESMTGRLSSCLMQIEQAILAATSQGAAGVLMKDSSLSQGYAPLVFLYQTLLPFGGAAWNKNRIVKSSVSGPDNILPQLLDTYVFNDRIDKGVLGGIMVSLGDLCTIAGDEDGKSLRRLLSQQDEEPMNVLQNLAYLGLRRAVKRADRMEVAMGSYEGNADSKAVAELRMAAIFMGVAARIGAWLLSISSAMSMEANGRAEDSEREVDRPISLTSLPDGRRSDLCNNILQAVELMRDAWMQRYHKLGFVNAVDGMVGQALTKLAQGMPYQGYLEERRTEEYEPEV